LRLKLQQEANKKESEERQLMGNEDRKMKKYLEKLQDMKT